MSFALTTSGLSTQTQTEVREALNQAIQARFGPNVNTSSDTLIGQLMDVIAEFEAYDQQIALAVYQSFDPNGAAGVALDRLSVLTGTLRKGAIPSVVTGVLTFSSAGTVANGDLIENDSTGTQWEAINGPYTAVGPFPQTIAAQFQSVDTGAIRADAGTTWNLVTIVPGLSSFANPTEDADLGRSAESDAALRRRRSRELYAQGQGPLATISGAISQVDGVQSVQTYHNPATNPVDANGIPFKRFNVVVRPEVSPIPSTVETAIFEAIWRVTGGGNSSFGTTNTGTITDSQGQPQPVAFDVVTELDVWVRLTLTTSTSEDSVTPNLNDIVAEAVLNTALTDHEVVGRDVQAWDYGGVVYDLRKAGEISGVDGLLAEVSFDGVTYVTTKLAIGIRELADFDSPRILVSQV